MGILEGIAFLHQHKVVHRDLKPSNILVVDRRDELIPKITDFGLSKQASADTKGSRFTNSFAGGTLQYSSPEQLKGFPLKLNTDLWSFGVIAYEILTGDTLFEADSQGTASAEWQNAITQKILHEDVTQQLATLPTNWEHTIKACLERDLTKRVQNTDALFVLLNGERSPKKEKEIPPIPPNDDETIIKEKPTPNSTPKQGPEKESETKPKEKPKWLIPTIAATAVIIIGALGYFMFQSDQKPTITHSLQLFEENGLYGYKMGDSIAITPQFLFASSFTEGKAFVKVTDSSYYINNKGLWLAKVTDSKIIQYKIEESKKADLVKKPIEKKKAKPIVVDKAIIPITDLKNWIETGNNLQNTKEAANAGNAVAQRRLGRINDTVYENYTEAVKWHTKSANQGNSNAQTSLGFRYSKGIGVKQDYKEAVKWLTKAANQGNSNAQFGLGVSYSKGIGVKQDYKEAVKWYTKSANQGNSNAQFGLGVSYSKGIGVKQDYKEAVKWLTKAANQGNSIGQYNLGTMYRDGEGVKQDKAKAKEWFTKACNKDYKKACDKLSSMD